VWEGAPLFYGSVMDTISADWRGERRLKGRTIAVQAGPMIDQARNDIVEAFLAHPDRPDWLLMVDADMVWTPGDVRRLFEAADAETHPVIGGLCFADDQRAGTIWPTMMVLHPGRDGESPDMGRVMDWPRGQIVKVDSTGAAFLLVHRSVYERVREVMGPENPAPWFFISYLRGIRLGEDVGFCLRCRALDIPVHVHTAVSIGHVKQRVLDEALFEDQQQRAKAQRPKLVVAR
jgi:hypothetical protein